MQWVREHISLMPSFQSFEKHISSIEVSSENNPSLCVEMCKSLIEGICKTIITNKKGPSSFPDQVNVLVKDTFDTLCLLEEETEKNDLAELGRRLASVTQKIAEIRNRAGFASHGQDIKTPTVSPSLSLLAMKTTDVICGYILHYYFHHNPEKGVRLHYEDNFTFNEYYDDLFPMQIGSIDISASKALFDQDIEAYKEALFGYMADLENGLLSN